LASPDCQDETLVQHWLAVQAGLSQSSNIDMGRPSGGHRIFPRDHCAFRRARPTVKDTEIRRLNPHSFRTDRTPVTVKKGQERPYSEWSNSLLQFGSGVNGPRTSHQRGPTWAAEATSPGHHSRRCLHV